MKKLILFLVFYYSLLITHNSLCQWVQMPNGMGINQNITSFTSNGNDLFAGSYSNGIFRSSNSGENWIPVNNGLTNININALISKNNILFAGTFGGGVFKSTNNGDNWFSVNSGLIDFYIQCFGSKDTIIFTGTSTYMSNPGVAYYSNSYGINWNIMGPFGVTVKTFTSSANYIFAGTAYNGIMGGVYRTSDFGVNWTAVNSGLTGYQLEANALVSDGANIFVGTNYGVYISNDYGNNWSPRNYGITQGSINCLTLYNSIYFVGKQDGVFVTTNYGAIWKIKNQGFTSIPSINSIYVFNNYVFAGTSGQSVWRRNYNEIINIKEISGIVPVSYSLEQNYPNPFNPSTKIKFSIPENIKWKMENGLVSLKVFDITGREVAELINEIMKPGIYEVTFDGSNLSSGVYYYKLITNSFSETKKMILLK